MSNFLAEWFIRRAGPRGAMTAGYTNLRKGKFEVAAEAFADAQRLLEEQKADPLEIAKAAENRAWCYEKLGRTEEAAALYEKALAIEVNLGSPPERLAQIREHIEWDRQAHESDGDGA